MICPDKVTTAQWLEVHGPRTASASRSNNTIMFGHVERPRALGAAPVCACASSSGGAAASPSSCRCRSCTWRRRSTSRAARARGRPTASAADARGRPARAAPGITNVQVSWVKAGPEGVRAALAAGVNDLGGTLMNESISRSAGSEFGQELAPERMEALIRSAGRVPRQRTTLYADAPAEQVARSFGAPPLEPLNPPVREAGLKRRRGSCGPGSSPQRVRSRRSTRGIAVVESRRCASCESSRSPLCWWRCSCGVFETTSPSSGAHIWPATSSPVSAPSRAGCSTSATSPTRRGTDASSTTYPRLEDCASFPRARHR